MNYHVTHIVHAVQDVLDKGIPKPGATGPVQAALQRAHKQAVRQGQAGEEAARELEYAVLLLRAYERAVLRPAPTDPKERLQHMSKTMVALSHAIGQTSEAVTVLDQL